jgi:alkanesulfonate monooxygenase SsuD/methylene tetrahydromethanopterin reductase-like flavin-dependent oxidoreductase (luciferase family)
MVSVGTDATAAREAVKATLAYYLYRVENVMHAHSGADPGDIQKVRDVTAEQGPEAGAAVVTDEIIDTFAIAGDTALAVRRFRDYAEAGIRGLIIQHIPGPERVAGLRLIAEEVVPHVL